MDTGLDKDNTRQYINVSTMAHNLGKNICEALPGYHAFTGCDFTASFFGKGKVRPFKLMRKSPCAIRAFSRLGESEFLEEKYCNEIELFVCSIYNVPTAKTTNDARIMLFHKKYSHVNAAMPLERVKKVDGSCLPPCSNAMKEKIKRSNYVAYIWKRANQMSPMPNDISPEDAGWQSLDTGYDIHWYTCNQMPTTLEASFGDVDGNSEVERDDGENEGAINDYESDSDESEFDLE